MSLKRNEKITCPQCSKQQLFPVWSVVCSTDGTGKKLILEDLLNVFRCVACGYRSFIDEGVVYDDAVNQYSIQYVPWFQCGTKAFYANLSKAGTVVLDPLTAKMVKPSVAQYISHPHFVFTFCGK